MYSDPNIFLLTIYEYLPLTAQELLLKDKLSDRISDWFTHTFCILYLFMFSNYTSRRFSYHSFDLLWAVCPQLWCQEKFLWDQLLEDTRIWNWQASLPLTPRFWNGHLHPTKYRLLDKVPHIFWLYNSSHLFFCKSRIVIIIK